MISLLNILYEDLEKVDNKDSIFHNKKYEADPSDEQIENDSYKKPRAKWNGLSLALENPKGSERVGKDKKGNVIWKNLMYCDYGEIVRTVGADKDAIDFFMGEDPESDFVYIVDQKKINKKTFDEHKVILGTQNENEAKGLYLKNYTKDWLKMQGGELIGVGMNVDHLKVWLKKHPKTKKASEVIK